MVNHQTLEPFLKDVYGDLTPLYGSGFYHWHRVQLHRTLRELAAAPEDPRGPTADITLGHKIADVDCDDGLIILTNGEKVRKDLIIVADGYQVRIDKHVLTASNHDSHHLTVTFTHQARLSHLCLSAVLFSEL